MKITFLIGNGFDMKIGMKTSYSNYYGYYNALSASNQQITDLKQIIDKDIANGSKNWSDLELALGEYTKTHSSFDEFELVLEDIRKNLAEYLEIEEKKYKFGNPDHMGKLRQDLAFPEKHLTNAEIKEINNHKNKWKASQWDINVITFNYTYAFEKILGYKNQGIGMPKHHISVSSVLQQVYHIHGATNGNMVLGVNDINQIANKEFRINRDLLDAFVKEECNKCIGHLINDTCKEVINKSNLVCLFGLSLGDTDKMWWEIIGERLRSEDVRLIIFHKGDAIPEIDGYKKRREKDKIKDIFLSKTKLDEEEMKIVRDKIYVGYNTPIFDITLMPNGAP